MINFSYQQESFADNIDERKIKDWLRLVISSEHKKEGDIQYVFCSDKYLNSINVTFLDHDTFTDIISFPTTENSSIISGEIYLSVDRVIENSQNIGSLLSTELSRVIVHGILHFIGYDDHSEEEKKEMRNKEDYYLNLQA